jgi:hypothetical protein
MHTSHNKHNDPSPPVSPSARPAARPLARLPGRAQNALYVTPPGVWVYADGLSFLFLFLFFLAKFRQMEDFIFFQIGETLGVSLSYRQI